MGERVVDFNRWLTLTGEKQRTTFGIDPSSLEGSARAEYVRWNCLAMHSEITELLDSFVWKPWDTKNTPGEVLDRDNVIMECVDLMHYISNILQTVGCEGDELSMTYNAKVRENTRRQREGYDTKAKQLKMEGCDC